MTLHTYLPLYRKYRPQSFADVVGQGPIIQTLSNAINNQQVAHAYLFCGPRGTGKTSTARIFAKSLNCEQGPTTTPCQTCASCTSVTAGNALDVIEFDAASNNSVDDARELIENCQFSPMQGKYKIYIIDEVHMLSTSAFNALLKTLEEPPDGVIFIFATTEAHKVLPTIISRCQRFDFSRIGMPELISHLTQVSNTENIQIEALAIQAIARHARGGLRDALSLLDQVGVLSRSQTDYVITPDDVARFLGSLTEDALVQLTEALQKQDVTALTHTVSNLLQHGIEPRQLLKSVTEHLRNLFLVASCQQQSGILSEVETNALADQLAVTPEQIHRLAALQQGFELSLYPQILAQLGDMDRHLRHSTNPHLWLEIGLVNLAYQKDIITLTALKQRLEALEQGHPTHPPVAAQQPSAPIPPQATPPISSPSAPAQPTQSAVPPPQAIIPQPAAQPAAVHQPLAQKPQPTQSPAPSHPEAGNWAQLVQTIASPGVKALLSQHGQLLDVSLPSITIGCSSEAILNTLKQEGKFFHLQHAMDKYFGRTIHIQLTLHQGPPPQATASLPKAFPSKPDASPQYSQNQKPAEPNALNSADTSVATSETPTSIPHSTTQQDQPSDFYNPPTPTEKPSQQPEYQPQPAQTPQPALQDKPIVEGPHEEPDLEEAKQYTAQLLQGSIIPPKATTSTQDIDKTPSNNATTPRETVASPT